MWIHVSELCNYLLLNLNQLFTKKIRKMNMNKIKKIPQWSWHTCMIFNLFHYKIILPSTSMIKISMNDSLSLSVSLSAPFSLSLSVSLFDTYWSSGCSSVCSVVLRGGRTHVRPACTLAGRPCSVLAPDPELSPACGPHTFPVTSLSLLLIDCIYKHLFNIYKNHTELAILATD